MAVEKLSKTPIDRQCCHVKRTIIPLVTPDRWARRSTSHANTNVLHSHGNMVEDTCVVLSWAWWCNRRKTNVQKTNRIKIPSCVYGRTGSLCCKESFWKKMPPHEEVVLLESRAAGQRILLFSLRNHIPDQTYTENNTTYKKRQETVMIEQDQPVICRRLKT